MIFRFTQILILLLLVPSHTVCIHPSSFFPSSVFITFCHTRLFLLQYLDISRPTIGAFCCLLIAETAYHWP
ncbi:hypothetical protein F5887DRAFT_421779 [Amanita rubescens]|nr:hypothetical protein F5887DRAFT_421779 [Amanita rubescens]